MWRGVLCVDVRVICARSIGKQMFRSTQLRKYMFMYLALMFVFGLMFAQVVC